MTKVILPAPSPSDYPADVPEWVRVEAHILFARNLSVEPGYSEQIAIADGTAYYLRFGRAREKSAHWWIQTLPAPPAT